MATVRANPRLNVELVCMPWQTLAFPSLALATLAALVADRRPQHRVRQRHGHIAWMRHMRDASLGTIGVSDYGQIVDRGLMHGLGDWVFAPALYGEQKWFREKFAAYVEHHDVEAPHIELMSRLSAEFCDDIAKEICDGSPDVVGFSSVFAQNIASLAVAKRVKTMAPETTIVLGGANCDGPMGEAMHQNFGFIDLIVRGEGEEALLSILDEISSDGESLAVIPGLVWRDERGRTVANAMQSSFFDLNASPVPDFFSFFDELDGADLWPPEQVRLPLESSRGCWWGAKRHCTFCGLNGSAMTYRMKSASKFLNEMDTLLSRHPSFEFAMADNILDPSYLSDVMPELARRDQDVRIHYEIKANLSTEDVERLRIGGVTRIQPGIESLSSPVLALMRKGVSAAQNVALMRDALERSITVEWNLLFGFPGEVVSDYEDMCSQFPSLWHLSAPHSALRILLERFSPNFDDPEFGFTVRRPRKMYEHVYNLPRSQMMDLAFHFETAPQGITGEDARALATSVEQWGRHFTRSQLLMTRTSSESLVIVDRRGTANELVSEIPGDWRAHAFILLRDGLGLPTLRSRLAATSHDVEPRQLEDFVDGLFESRLVFCDRGKARDQPRFVALPTWREPVKSC